jgi:hypothetical protein
MGVEERGRLFGICLDGLRKTIKNTRPADVSEEIRTQHLPNTIQERLSPLAVCQKQWKRQDDNVGLSSFHYKIQK